MYVGLFYQTGSMLLMAIKKAFENLKKISYKYLLCVISALVLLAGLFFYINNIINFASEENQYIFSYTVKVRDSIEELDKIFERAEVNVNVMGDSISNSYNSSKQQNEAYNLSFIEGINGLIKSVLSNSPGVDGAWFQLNADLPFSAYAYNWYEFKDNQFIDVKDQFEGTPSKDRKITPEDDPYYFEAINSQKPVWSSIYTDADTKDSMMTISSPIYKDGKLVGVVGIDISVDNLQQQLKNMQSILGKSELYLLDKENNVILSQLASNSNITKVDFPFLSLFNKNKTGPVEYYQNMTKKTAIKLTLSNDYKIIIAIKNKILFSDAKQIANLINILFILLVLAVAALFVYQFKIMLINQSHKIVDEEVDAELVPKEEI